VLTLPDLRSSELHVSSTADPDYSDSDTTGAPWNGPGDGSPTSFLGKLGIDSTGLLAETSLIIPQELSLEQWETLGDRLFSCWESMSWWIGDWLVYGQDHYPDRYKTAIQRTGLSYQTLRNYASVARKFRSDRRKPDLSFQHHAVVASLPAEEQDRWLARAQRFAWSRNELRRRLRAYELNGAKDTCRDFRFQVRVDADVRERWLMAAQADNESLDTWIVKVLNQAASPTGEPTTPPWPTADSHDA
jgi:hypothetical protein